MAKVTVSFVTDDDSGNIQVESDPERNIDYTGRTKTKFRYGDTAYFRVYTNEPSAVLVTASDGTLTDMGIYTADITETVTFITEQTADTEKHVKNLSSYVWLGSSLGTLSVSGVQSVKSAESPSAEKIASANITYRTAYRLFGLTLAKKNMDEYPVAVYVRLGDV